MDVYVKAYVAAAVILAIVQTVVMLKDPPEKAFPVIAFYIAAPFLPIIAVVAYPFVIYRSIEEAWDNSLKRQRQRVKKR